MIAKCLRDGLSRKHMGNCIFSINCFKTFTSPEPSKEKPTLPAKLIKLWNPPRRRTMRKFLVLAISNALIHKSWSKLTKGILIFRYFSWSVIWISAEYLQLSSFGLRSISGNIVVAFFGEFVFSEVSWSMKPFKLGLDLCLSALWNIPGVRHNRSTLSTVLKTAIFSLMFLSGVTIIFESERTSFPWYQWSFIESFLSIVSHFKIVGIRFFLLFCRSLRMNKQ